mmetsp:Transcript_18881/g.34177  ORF Transcript_18881/g.34177 Transcript_18881/m.34177 type:complete len:574 (-) Transcript_18881:1218-2939(-)
MGCHDSRPLAKPGSNPALKSITVTETTDEGLSDLNSLSPEELRKVAADSINKLNTLYKSLATQINEKDPAPDDPLSNAIRDFEETKQHIRNTSIATTPSLHNRELSRSSVGSDNYLRPTTRRSEGQTDDNMIQRLSIESNTHKMKRRQYQLLHALTIVEQKLKQNMTVGFNRLMSKVLVQLNFTRFPTKLLSQSCFDSSNSLMSVTKSDTASEATQNVKALLEQEVEQLANKSLLNQYFAENRAATVCKTLSVDRMFELLEACMDAKLKHDDEIIETGGIPIDNGEFFMIHFRGLYDTESLFTTRVVKLLRSLESVAKMDHPYAIQLCKFFNVFDKVPYLRSVGNFYNSMRSEFTYKGARSIYSIIQKNNQIKAIDACFVILALFEADGEACTSACKVLKKYMTDIQLSAVLLTCLFERSNTDIYDFCSTLTNSISAEDLLMQSTPDRDVCFNLMLISGLILPHRQASKAQFIKHLQENGVTLNKSQILEALICGYSHLFDGQITDMMHQLADQDEVTEEAFCSLASLHYSFLSKEKAAELYKEYLGEKECLNAEEACVAIMSKLGVRFAKFE